MAAQPGEYLRCRWISTVGDNLELTLPLLDARLDLLPNRLDWDCYRNGVRLPKLTRNVDACKDKRMIVTTCDKHRCAGKPTWCFAGII